MFWQKKMHVTTLPEPNYTSGVENAHQKCAKKLANKHANFLTFLDLYVPLDFALETIGVS